MTNVFDTRLVNRYSTYNYIYPPRPENTVPPANLRVFDNGTYLAQPKLDGDCCEIFTNGREFHYMNRHCAPIKGFTIPLSEIKFLYKNRKGWLVLVGEYMNSSKRDENGQIFNKKLVLFDTLVVDGQYLLNTTFLERRHLLNTLYGKEREDKPMLTQLTDNIYKVVSIESGFKDALDRITRFQMYEGLVLKLKNGKLERGDRELNNWKTQIKARKQNNKYAY